MPDLPRGIWSTTPDDGWRFPATSPPAGGRLDGRHDQFSMRILFVAPRFHTNQVDAIRSLVACGHQVWFHAATIGPVEDHSEVVPHVHTPSFVSHLLARCFGTGVNNLWYVPAPVTYWREFRAVAPDVAVVRWHNPI